MTKQPFIRKNHKPQNQTLGAFVHKRPARDHGWRERLETPGTPKFVHETIIPQQQ